MSRPKKEVDPDIRYRIKRLKCVSCEGSGIIYQPGSNLFWDPCGNCAGSGVVEMKEFKTTLDAASHVSTTLESATGTFSVGTLPVTAAERSNEDRNVIFVRWTDGPSFGHVKALIDDQRVILRVVLGPVHFMLTRSSK